jgi:hypothetical protein
MELNLKLSIDHANVIMEALNNAPYRVAAPVIATIQQQFAEQTKPQLVPQTAGPQVDAKVGAE